MFSSLLIFLNKFKKTGSRSSDGSNADVALIHNRRGWIISKCSGDSDTLFFDLHLV